MREALKLALEALNHYEKAGLATVKTIDAITAIKEALAQPEQEPVVWMYQDKSTHEVRFQKHMRDFVDHGAWYEVPLYSEPLANQEKTSGSPIKELNCICGAVWEGEELVHIPPQRKPLTDEQIGEIGKSHEKFSKAGNEWFDRWAFARAIEAAHGIKE